MRWLNPVNHNLGDASLFILVILTGVLLITDAQAGNYYNGRKIYGTYCESCHGNDGRGELSGAPNFTRGLSMMKPDSALFETVINGRNAMPGFQGVLKSEDIYDVISYIRSFH
ncbi:c-type cytochrome [Kaarinaea lacus]